jgi:hypothetical protein
MLNRLKRSSVQNRLRKRHASRVLCQSEPVRLSALLPPGVKHLRQPRAKARKTTPEHFHNFCNVDFVVSHPFHKEREMDGARSFLTPSVKMF